MFQISQIRNLILPFLLMVSYTCASAFNLPTKTINGKEYYYYNVQAHETIYSIAHKLNTTKDEIIKYNPSAIDGIKNHDVLYFPKTETSISTQTNYINHTVKKKETIYGISRQYGITVDQLIADNPSAQDGIKQGDILNIVQSTIPSEVNTDNDQTTSDNAVLNIDDTQPHITQDANYDKKPDFVNGNNSTILSEELSLDSAIIENPDGPTQVAIILPFMLNREKPLKQDRLYTDFYRGFLIALNQLQESSDITLRVYDTADSLSCVKDILSKDEMQDIDLIIAPEDDDQLDLIASFANEHKCHVLNLYNIKSQLHKTNEWVIQGNIPQEELYKTAINYIIDSYRESTPVFLRNKEHLSDKLKFTTQLKVALDTAKIDYLEIAYTDILDDDEMSKLNDTTSYVFIPTSAAKKDLVTYAVPLCRLKDKTPNRQLNIFGYPEWITYKGSITKRMAELGTTFYSRFKNSNETDEHFNNEFKQWFGNKSILSYPNQALLGYDTARFIIESVFTYGFFNPEHKYLGIQNSFDFITSDENAGFHNNSASFISLGLDK